MPALNYWEYDIYSHLRWCAFLLNKIISGYLDYNVFPFIPLAWYTLEWLDTILSYFLAPQASWSYPNLLTLNLNRWSSLALESDISLLCYSSLWSGKRRIWFLSLEMNPILASKCHDYQFEIRRRELSCQATCRSFQWMVLFFPWVLKKP